MKDILLIRSRLISLHFLVCFLLLFLVAFPNPLVAEIPIKPLFEQALSASKEGDFSSALFLWDQVLEESPKNSAALSNRGNVRLALGDFSGAIADQSHSIELDPSELDPYLNRGIAKEALHHWQSATEDYEWVLSQDPENASALYNLGNVLSHQG